MQNFGRKLSILLLKVFDLLFVTGSIFLAESQNDGRLGSFSLRNLLSRQIRIKDLLVFALFLLAWHGLFSMFGLYRSRRISKVRCVLQDVFKATSAGCPILIGLGRIFGMTHLTARFTIVFWAISTVSAITARFAVKHLMNLLRLRGRNLRHLLIVGTNGRALDYAAKITAKPELGYVIVGFVENSWSGNGEFLRSGYEIVTDFSKFPDFVRSNVVDEVMICLPLRSQYEQASRIVKSCEEQGIIVRFLSDFFDLDLAVSRAEMVDDASVVTLRTGAMQGGRLLVKRAIDIVFSSLLLLLLSPFLTLIALLVKLTSAGPVFFSKPMLGYNKREFKILKFRTMLDGADKMIDRVAHLNQECGPGLKIKNDPRITGFGKFLRKTSLDELPQLLNVLKGEMSLVGPRPLCYWEFDRIDDSWSWVRRRFSVKPGITGLWQVSGRSNIPFDGRIKMDLKYIDDWSLRNDFHILAKTVVVVITGHGAC
ncbi:MAG: sugar transferase [Syntrophobacteraceae bacterium]